MRRIALVLSLTSCLFAAPVLSQYADSNGRLRIALVKQPFVPNGTSTGPATMASGGLQEELAKLGATVRVSEIGLTKEQEPEYGGWKRLGYALGHLGRAVAANEREGWFTVGLLGTCPSMPGMVAGFQHAGPTSKPLRVGLLWLDAHPDFNTPETTRSGSLGGMPVAVATGRCLTGMRLDAGLDPPLADEHVVMGGVRLTDPLEQELLDKSKIQQLSVKDLQTISPAVTAQLDRLSKLTDKIYVHIDMDVLDPREVEAHGNKVPGGPSSEELARLFEMIFRRYPKASGIGFATIPPRDEGGLSLAAVHRMVLGAVRGLKARPLARMEQIEEILISYRRPDLLVDADWVAAHNADAAVRLVDLRPNGYEAGHIPGAVHLDNAAIRDVKNTPTFVPTPAAFATLMRQLGISNRTRVIAYDERGGIYAARLWWILNYYGHANVALLNGGWTKWTADGRPTSTETPAARNVNFTAKADPRWLATAADVLSASQTGRVKILDARTVNEIEGRDLRGIKRGGAIPGSTPLYWEDLLDPQTRMFKTPNELKTLLTARGLKTDDDIIAYCQVGMRASHDLFTLHLMGFDKLRNYYGAWEEWGNRSDLPLKK
jgi:3-mercaptopyruvate sulfurtransferase SseA/arginase family enzyme